MVLLIGGHQRSGTTLLKNICNYHPDITVMSEFGIFHGLGEPYWTYKLRILHKRRKYIFKKRSFVSSHFKKRQKSTLNIFWNNTFVVRYLLKLYRYHSIHSITLQQRKIKWSPFKLYFKLTYKNITAHG